MSVSNATQAGICSNKTGLKKLCLIPFLFFCYSLFSQGNTLNGIVVDAATGKPLANASVFINGTSKGTVTNAEGVFKLAPPTSSSYEIIVSFVGYTTVQLVATPAEFSKRLLFELNEMEAETKDVVIEPDVKDGWTRWGKTFLQSFIGQSELADRCILKNPEVLRFKYNSKTGTLRVIARDALQIENNGLGYKIRYLLEQFEYNSRSGMVVYLGYQYYTPFETSRKKKLERFVAARQEAYNGSILHYIRSAYSHTLVQEGFETRLLKKVERVDSVLVNGMYKVRKRKVDILDKNILADSLFIKTDSSGLHQFLVFDDYLDIIYKKEKEKPAYVATQYPTRKAYNPISQIWLINNRPVQIEANGLYFNPLDLFTNGYWGWEKLAEMVPGDYMPGD